MLKISKQKVGIGNQISAGIKNHRGENQTSGVKINTRYNFRFNPVPTFFVFGDNHFGGFGGGGFGDGTMPQHQQGQKRGAEIVHELPVTLEDLCKGCTKKMKITRYPYDDEKFYKGREAINITILPKFFVMMHFPTRKIAI
jgi:DnaJ-class molecular chaperone